jgi:hypothetical protein
MKNSELIIYQDPDGRIKIDVRLEDETVWLAQDHMAELFGKSKKTISEHIRNIFNEGELEKNMVVRKFRTTTRHGAILRKMRSSYWGCWLNNIWLLPKQWRSSARLCI